MLDIVRNESVDDYSTILDDQVLSRHNVDLDISDVESLTLQEPNNVFLPNSELWRQILKAMRVYGHLSKRELHARFGFY